MTLTLPRRPSVRVSSPTLRACRSKRSRRRSHALATGVQPAQAVCCHRTLYVSTLQGDKSVAVGSGTKPCTNSALSCAALHGGGGPLLLAQVHPVAAGTCAIKAPPACLTCSSALWKASRRCSRLTAESPGPLRRSASARYTAAAAPYLGGVRAHRHTRSRQSQHQRFCSLQ